MEASRRLRAMRILKDAKGKGHLSDSGSNSDDEGDEDVEMNEGKDDEMKLDRELIASTSKNSITTTTRPASTPFNASGSLGVVVNHNPANATSARPPIPPSKLTAPIGSGLKAGVVVTVIKKGPKKKGVRSALGERLMNKVRLYLFPSTINY